MYFFSLSCLNPKLFHVSGKAFSLSLYHQLSKVNQSGDKLSTCEQLLCFGTNEAFLLVNIENIVPLSQSKQRKVQIWG
jgi:hypothetical protein